MEAREYFEKEYGHKHIETVIEMQDWVSLYGLIDEFAEWKVKKYSTPNVSGMFSSDMLEQAYKDGVRDALAKGYGTFNEENYV